MIKLWVTAWLTVCASLASAARFEVNRDLAIVHVTGRIVPGDADDFASAIAPLVARRLGSIVFLDSPGGNLFTALQIGRTLHQYGFATAVTDGGICASACALIWLAGVRRYYELDDMIGFHAASIDGKESGVANALVGSYLRTLGLSDEVIIFATIAPPSEVRWLTADGLIRLNIDFEKGISWDRAPPRGLSWDEAMSPPPPPRAGIPGNVDPAPPGPEAPPWTLFAKPISIPPSPRGLATVVPDGPKLKFSSQQLAVSLAPAYGEGRQARLAYEAWFDSLVPGRFRDGAAFYAANRSRTPLSACYSEADIDWHDGRVQALNRLQRSDQRRKTDRDFWLGWNSL